MAQVEFKYKGISTVINCKENEIMKNIIEEFIQRAGIDNKQVYFIYGGNADIKAKEKLTFLEVANSEDKNQKKMTILVSESIPEEKEKNSRIKSKFIICPICGENIKIKLNNLRISLYGCKNGHKIDDLSLDEFKETQYIDLSKIKCSKCNETKSNTFNNQFYKCTECNINLCPLCNKDHKHYTIDYDQINYNNNIYIKYCDTCKEYICSSCDISNRHRNHGLDNLTNYDFKRNLENLKDNIDNINFNIYKIIERLNNIRENLKKYYDFVKESIQNYKIENCDFFCQIFNYNNNIKDINKKNGGKSISQIFENLMNFYKKINSNTINITLKIRDIDIHKNIYFLDNTHGSIYINDKYEEHNHDFLKELNESNTDLFINNIKYKFQKYFKPDKEGLYSILIKLKNGITDCSCMFYACHNLVNIDLSCFNTKNVGDMQNMFSLCDQLTNIDLSYFNTENVTNMNCMFYGCFNLKVLGLSSFNTKNTNSLASMFQCCNNLIELDLSSFNTENVTNMSGMFDSCNLLEKINLSSFNTEKVSNMNCMFYNCGNLKNIDLSSSFTIKNAICKNMMFENCLKLKNIDLSLFKDKNAGKK